MKSRLQYFFCILLLLVFTGFFCPTAFAQSLKIDRQTRKIHKTVTKWAGSNEYSQLLGSIGMDSFIVAEKDKQMMLYFPERVSYLPIREEFYHNLNQSFLLFLKKKYRGYSFDLYSNGYLLSELIPNIYRKQLLIDHNRIGKYSEDRLSIVKKIDGVQPSFGLNNCHMAVWHSHGFYYNSKLDQWIFQRPRLFGTIEDLSTMTYVLPYLTPMLENAGASVFLPRERDTQKNEVIVDYDRSTGNSEVIFTDLDFEIRDAGFLLTDTIFPGENPFKMGSSISIMTEKNHGKSVNFVPDIPEKGKYAVYVSYVQDNKNKSDVIYTVKHTGGETRFLVNQKMGGSTWIYLGTFVFKVGKNIEEGAVQVMIDGSGADKISLDAVRFGGGMGNVARRPAEEILPNLWSLNSQVATEQKPIKVNPQTFNWKLSGKPRYMEGARYYLQYSGMPDSLVYSFYNNKNDYNDDYTSRGEWVNYLIGHTEHQQKINSFEGLNIPIDLSMAFHTDAGIANNAIVGTLAIYNTKKDNSIISLVGGQSKLASRDLTDLIQTQIVDDIRQLHNPLWMRRGLWDKAYAEAWRPIVPSILLELLSHQNATDMRFSLDPRFRFTVSRAIYKGMLQFIAYQQGRDYVVQPLPVDHFSITPLTEKTIKLQWRPVDDPLEATAKPSIYKVYQRMGDGGFDNGTLVEDTILILELGHYDSLYTFKITALNDGGESFPSETLSVGFSNQSKGTVLIVNKFNRICGPTFFDNEDMGGIAWWDDEGVPHHEDIGFCGRQYDFNKKSQWQADDNPGWGASYGDMEGKIIPGNTFDFPAIHGEAILANGYSFLSISDETFCIKDFDTSPYQIVDIILGEEKSTPDFSSPGLYNFMIYTPEFQEKIREITENGKGVFISGAYVGTDLAIHKDSLAIGFAKDVLHFTWRTNHASKEGKVHVTDIAKEWFQSNVAFNTNYHPSIYTVEAPDMIDPVGNSISAFRYTENNGSAGVAYRGSYRSLVLGFPFETIIEKKDRVILMHQILDFLWLAE